MENLNFTQEGAWYVSQDLAGGDDGMLIPHINYPKSGARVVVERTIDEELGWAEVASRSAGLCYEETITGVVSGVKVRVRTDEKPSQAVVLTL